MQLERALTGWKAHPLPSAWLGSAVIGKAGKVEVTLLSGRLVLASPLQHPTGAPGEKLHPGSAWAAFLSFQGQDFLQQGLMFPELPPSAPTMLNKCICFLQILGSARNQSYMEMRRSGMPLCNPMVSHPDRAQLQVICSPLNHIF